MNVKNIYEIFDCMLTIVELYIVYAHIYGIEVSVFRKGKMEDTMKKLTLFYKFRHIKPSIWITFLGIIVTSVTWKEEVSDVQTLLFFFFIQSFSFCLAKERKFKNS